MFSFNLKSVNIDWHGTLKTLITTKTEISTLTTESILQLQLNQTALLTNTMKVKPL